MSNVITVLSIAPTQGYPVAATYRNYAVVGTAGIQHMIITDPLLDSQLSVLSYSGNNPLAVALVNQQGSHIAVHTVTIVGTALVSQQGSFIVSIPSLAVFQANTPWFVVGSTRVTQADTASPFTVIVRSTVGFVQAGSWTVTEGQMQGAVDPFNSTSGALGIGATFTGSPVDLCNYAGSVLTIFADKASAANGIQLQYSNDLTNWDYILAGTLAGSGALSYNITPNGRYFRLVYTNGGTAQGAFRVQNMLKPFAFQFGGIAVTQATSPWGISGNISVDTGSKGLYLGDAVTTLTFSITLASLADGAARQSNAFTNAGSNFIDVLVSIKCLVNTSGVSSYGAIDVFALGALQTVFGGNDFLTDLGTGVNAAWNVPLNAPLLGVLVVNSNGMVVQGGPWSVAQAFGGYLPPTWAIGVRNRTGAILAGSETAHQKLWMGIIR